MPILISNTAKGVHSTPTGERAGERLNIELTHVIRKGTTLAAGTKLELGYLPAYHHIIGGALVNDAMGAGITANVGLMTGEQGVADDNRTVGTELFNAQAVATAGNTPLTSATAIRLTPVDYHRGIGLVLSGAVTAPAGNDLIITLSLGYAQAGDRTF